MWSLLKRDFSFFLDLINCFLYLFDYMSTLQTINTRQSTVKRYFQSLDPLYESLYLRQVSLKFLVFCTFLYKFWSRSKSMQYVSYVVWMQKCCCTHSLTTYLIQYTLSYWCFLYELWTEFRTDIFRFFLMERLSVSQASYGQV